MLRPTPNPLLCLLLFLVLWAEIRCPSVARAQAQPDQTAIQVQRFQPSLDLHGLFQSVSARPLGQWGWAFGGTLHYTDRPLAGGDAEGQPVGLLSHQWQLDLQAGVGVLPWLEFAVRVPLLLQEGQFPESQRLYGSLAGQSLDGFFVSDVQLSAKVILLGRNRTGFCMGLLGFVNLPVAHWAGQASMKMSGDDGLGGGGSLLLSRHDDRSRFALNIGYRFHAPTQLLNLNITHELRLSAGFAFQFLPRRLELIVDVFGAMFLERTDLFQLPFEAQTGLRFYPTGRRSLSLTVGVGAPLSPGVGVGRIRVFVSVLWTRSREVFADTDRDGVVDYKDHCPTRFGSRANKGCPWPDTDGDGTDDTMDRCPKVRGPMKNAGCPWPDTDSDGLDDQEDRCPKLAGPVKNAGCPWPDKDKDTVADKDDRCPTKPGPPSNQGCPVQVRKTVPMKRKIRRTFQSLFFSFNRWNLRSRERRKLRSVLSYLQRNPSVRVVLIGFADNTGTRRYNLWISRKRAWSVMAYLRRYGIAKKRIRLRAMGDRESRRRSRRRRRQARFRRVDFVIVLKEQPS